MKTVALFDLYIIATYVCIALIKDKIMLGWEFLFPLLALELLQEKNPMEGENRGSQECSLSPPQSEYSAIIEITDYDRKCQDNIFLD